MAVYQFDATTRIANGKKSARGLRNIAKLPAVVYGRGEKSLAVEVDAKEIPLLYMRTVGKNALLTMNLTDAKGAKSESLVMFKEIQREPVKSKFLHVDFYHVDPKHPIKLKVPVVLDGIPKGVKESFGILNHPTRTLTIKCLPADIPTEIRVDVTGLDLEQSLILKDLTPPKGVTWLSAGQTVLALVTASEEEKAPEPAAVDAAAAAAAKGPEVIKEKKPAEGEAAPAAKAGGKPAPKAPAEKKK